MKQGLAFFVISAFNLILISLLSFPSSYCQGGSTEKDNCKQTNQTTSPPPQKKSVFWGHLYRFFGLVTAQSLKPSQGGGFSLRVEPVAWSAQAKGGTGGVERFGGGEGKAHLLYSWPLCVKQALWAVTELERRASERPLALL